MQNSTCDGFECLCNFFLKSIEVRSVFSEHAVLQVYPQKKIVRIQARRIGWLDETSAWGDHTIFEFFVGQTQDVLVAMWCSTVLHKLMLVNLLLFLGTLIRVH